MSVGLELVGRLPDAERVCPAVHADRDVVRDLGHQLVF
jgi:hypothetical protein